MKKTFLLLLFFPVYLYAQDSTKYFPNYLFLSLNGVFTVNQNIKISPATYFGFGGGIDIGYLREGRKFRQEIKLGNNAALAVNPNSLLNSNQQINYYGHLDYSFLKPVKKNILKNQLFFGIAAHLQGYLFYNSALSNSALNYDFFSGLDIKVINQFFFRFFHYSFTWEQSINYGILSNYLKDAYSYPAPEGYISASGGLFSKFVKSLSFKSPFSLPRFIVKENLIHDIHNGNRWSLAYEWNFYKLSIEMPRMAAFHSLSFTFYFNL